MTEQALEDDGAGGSKMRRQGGAVCVLVAELGGRLLGSLLGTSLAVHSSFMLRLFNMANVLSKVLRHCFWL